MVSKNTKIHLKKAVFSMSLEERLFWFLAVFINILIYNFMKIGEIVQKWSNFDRF